MSTAILAPVIALVIWSQIMWAWMYATRIPAMMAARMKLDPATPQYRLTDELPASVRWKADNYNHLMEQPTVFYAVAISLAVLGEGAGINLILAWSYVALRIAHSLVHALGNRILRRFGLFMASNLPLIALTVSAVVAILN